MTHSCSVVHLFSKYRSEEAISIEPPRDKTNKVACVPSEDSAQPWHPPSLIEVFTVHMKKAQVLSYPLSAQRRLIRLGRCPGLIESLLGTHATLMVLSRGGSIFSVCLLYNWNAYC